MLCYQMNKFNDENEANLFSLTWTQGKEEKAEEK